MSIPIKLQVFEGPLDLLLHLIDKNKLNIYDIPIVVITEQYLDYIKQMEEKNLDIMSEFLVMAATLINIKSKMLLPPVKNDEEEELVDPREELIERLLEYKKYKHVSIELKEKQLDAERFLYKGPTIPEEVKNYEEIVPVESILEGIDLSKLYHIFSKVIKKQVDKVDPIRSTFGKIEREEYSIQDKISYLKDLLQQTKIISFQHLLEKGQSKQEVIATFLAVLELMKMGMIQIKQDEIFDDIMISSLLGKTN
jgi:segregation and condensation protein A